MWLGVTAVELLFMLVLQNAVTVIPLPKSRSSFSGNLSELAGEGQEKSYMDYVDSIEAGLPSWCENHIPKIVNVTCKPGMSEQARMWHEVGSHEYELMLQGFSSAGFQKEITMDSLLKKKSETVRSFWPMKVVMILFESKCILQGWFLHPERGSLTLISCSYQLRCRLCLKWRNLPIKADRE